MAYTVENIEIVANRPDVVSVTIMWDKGGSEEHSFTMQVQSNQEGLKRVKKRAADEKANYIKYLSETAKLTQYENAILNKLNG